MADDDCLSANQTDKISPDNSCSDGADVPKGRPMSPGTLALMCDEQDTMFMTSASPIGSRAHACNTSSQPPYGQGMTECSSLARSELESEKDPNNNCTGNTSTETAHQQGTTNNVVAKAATNITSTSSFPGGSLIPEK
ncbi:hypothetical protein V8G54_004325 [Vigna mungo]|uniref:Uncharacterized protein n=1 Tax=Vigna mungo TaxID=3915 RepID=A0AAQ3PBK1_VIGMU